MLVALLLLQVARAEDAPATSTPLPSPGPGPGTPAQASVTPIRTRTTTMELNIRARYMGIPQSILDAWYHRNGGTDSELPERPAVRAYVSGVEYVVASKGNNGIFYAEYIGVVMGGGYWDDAENPPDYSDGSYLQPNNLGMIAFGGNYAHVFEASPWFGISVGGGLGLGVLTGSVTEWDPGESEDVANPDNIDAECGRTDNAYRRFETGCANDGPLQGIPGVLPIIDVTAGLRFNLSDRASIRLEGGFHDMFYGGGAVGVMF